MNFLNSVSKKIGFFQSIIISGTLLLGVFSLDYVIEKAIIEKEINNLNQRTEDIKNSFQVLNDSIVETTKAMSKTFKVSMGELSVNKEKSITNKIETDTIYSNGTPLNNFNDNIDKFTETTGAVATVFVKHNDDFLRVATSLKKADGSRAMGTYLTKQSRAYDKIMNKQEYVGAITLFGKKYVAVYSPIIQNKEVVRLVNDAISVIDQIAFQTNILSLNARVERATAGEAGKGFAVVRQEVRNLANRSADARKEIKNIVEKATSKADEGKQIANEMIKGYSLLNSNIAQTITLISDVEMASKEQLVGIEQINDAVNKLDQQTQQNANVATQTHNVAIVIDDVAKLIVKNADAKEFIGKNEAVSKKFDIAKTDVKPLHNNVNKSKTPVINNNVNKNKTSITNNSNNKVVISSNTSDEEWESF